MRLRLGLVVVCAVYAGGLSLARHSEGAVLPSPSYSARTIESPAPEAFSRWGSLLHTVGDVDRDGDRDVAALADGASSGGVMGVGRVWILDGTTGRVILALEDPEPEYGAAFGASMAGLGDVNHDGVPDFAIGAPYASFTPGGSPCLPGPPPAPNCNVNQGKVYVFSGRSGKLLYAVNAPHPQANAYFGALYGEATNDLNGDGIPDFVETENGEDVNGVPSAGAAYLLEGKNGSIIRRIPNPHPETYTTFGETIFDMGLNVPGDVNGDGVDDIEVGFNATTVDGLKNAGRAYLFSGKTGRVLRSFTDPHPQADGDFGSGYSDPGAPGDVNGDHVPDIMIDAENQTVAGVSAGAAYIFSGRDGRLLQTLTSPTPIDASFFGYIYSPGGDPDGDKIPDILVGQTGSAHIQGAYALGGAWVFDGHTGKILADFRSIAPDAGEGVASPGDVNGDCIPDYFLGAPRTDVGAVKRQGRVFEVLSNGPNRCPPVLSRLRISPSAFVPASAGGSVTKRRHGARISYRDSLAALTVFRVAHSVRGYRKGAKCVSTPPRHAQAKRCRLVVTLGSFRHHDHAGRNRFFFTGRVAGHALAKGTYTLRATPRLAGRFPAATTTIRFTIKN